MLKRTVLVGILLLSLIYNPGATLFTLLLLNLIVMLIIGIGRIVACSLPPLYPRPSHHPWSGMISIHLPCRDEAPEMIIRTLNSIAAIQYADFEVIVLGSHTMEAAKREIVERHCRSLGEQFRFFHDEHTNGFKAGALNTCRELMDARAEYILVIDADCTLRPDIFHRAIPYFERADVGLVQFPQSFANVSAGNQGLNNEYQHFFAVYMNMANHFDCVLSTGTISFIRREALDRIGGWSPQSIAEDVALGLNLHRAGYRGVYVHQALATSLLPADRSSLSRQRLRWIYGSMQTLRHLLDQPIACSWQKFSALTLLLTAWFNFLLLPVGILFLEGLGRQLGWSWAQIGLGEWALGSMLLELGLMLLLFLFSDDEDRQISLGQRLGAFLTHLALSFEGAYAWCKIMLRPGMAFDSGQKADTGRRQPILPINWLFVAILAAHAIMLAPNVWVQGLEWLLVGLFLLSGAHLSGQLQITRQLTMRYLHDRGSQVSLSS